MSDLQEPSPVDYKDEESGLGKEENPFDCAKEDSQHSSTDGNQLDGMTSHDVTQPRMNGFINGDHQLNGHVSEEEEFEIDIDPRMDMMMLEPQVDIIEDPDDMPTPYIPNPQQQPARQQSIFRRKRVIAAKPAKAVQRRQPIESPGSKRRLVADDAEISDDRSGCRSLVCDSSGIIIAEMVFRCMICAHVSDAISTAHRHYQSAHMSRQSSSQTSSATNRGVNRSIPQSLDAEDDLDFENDIQSEPSRGRSHQGGKANQSVQQNVPSNSHPYLDSSFSDSLSAEDEGSDGNAGSEPSILKKPGKFVTAPTPSCYVPGRNSKTNREFADCFRFSVSNLGHTTESILGANSSQSSSSTARGGYV